MLVNESIVEFVHEVELEAAQRMLDAMLYLRFEYQMKVDRKYPPASTPGQYPAKRTGKGQDGCHVFPTSPEDIVNAGGVYIGFTDETWYMPYLEREKGRLGLGYLYLELEHNISRLMDMPLYQRGQYTGGQH